MIDICFENYMKLIEHYVGKMQSYWVFSGTCSKHCALNG
jgi:hypothetical protein